MDTSGLDSLSVHKAIVEDLISIQTGNGIFFTVLVSQVYLFSHTDRHKIVFDYILAKEEN